MPYVENCRRVGEISVTDFWIGVSVTIAEPREFGLFTIAAVAAGV